MYHRCPRTRSHAYVCERPLPIEPRNGTLYGYPVIGLDSSKSTVTDQSSSARDTSSTHRDGNVFPEVSEDIDTAIPLRPCDNDRLEQSVRISGHGQSCAIMNSNRRTSSSCRGFRCVAAGGKLFRLRWKYRATKGMGGL